MAHMTFCSDNMLKLKYTLTHIRTTTVNELTITLIAVKLYMIRNRNL